MRVVLDEALFGPGVSALALDELMLASQRLEHVLETVPPFVRGGTSAAESWIQGRDERYRSAWEDALDAGLDASATLPLNVLSIRVIPGPTSWPTLHLGVADATRLLNSPLELLLENSVNDFEFLTRIADGERRAALARAQSSGRLRTRHGGGIPGIAQQLTEVLARITGQGGASAGEIERLRLWVLFDRDAADDDARLPSNASLAVTAQCQELSATWVRLERRSAESYLPAHALHAWAVQVKGAEQTQRRKKVDAFLSADFGAERRHSFAMKDGLLKDLPNRLHAEVTAQDAERDIRQGELPPPFHDLAPTLLATLRLGFGSDIGRHFGAATIDDSHFEDVFARDAGARTERENIFRSLFSRL